MDQVCDLMCRKLNSIRLVEPSLYTHQEDMLWCSYLGAFRINITDKSIEGYKD